jgi:hypothetical protein
MEILVAELTPGKVNPLPSRTVFSHHALNLGGAWIAAAPRRLIAEARA